MNQRQLFEFLELYHVLIGVLVFGIGIYLMMALTDPNRHSKRPKVQRCRYCGMYFPIRLNACNHCHKEVPGNKD